MCPLMQFDSTARVIPNEIPQHPLHIVLNSNLTTSLNFPNSKTFEDIEGNTLIYVCKKESQIL